LALIALMGLFLSGCAPAEPVPACPARQTALSPADAANLEERITALSRADGPSALVVTEAEVNAYIEHRVLRTSDHEARITFGSDGVCLAAELAVRQRHVPLIAWANLSTSEGTLSADLVAVRLGRWRLPTLLRRSLESMLNELLAEQGGSASIESVSIDDGILELVVVLNAVP